MTNPTRLKKAIEGKDCNSILIKVNQIGTLTETLDVIKQAREADFGIVVSHRSGETTDDFIADLAVGAGADYIKMQKKDVNNFYSQEKLLSPYKSPYGKNYKQYRNMFEWDKEAVERASV